MVLLVVAVSGLVSAQPLSSISKLIHAMVGLLLVSASGCALNQYLERYVDWLMPRTAKRPLPDQRLSAGQVATFGAVTFGIGIAYLSMLVNWQTVLLAAISWFLYVWVYTPLKARSWLNTYVGAVAGALPVLVGSAAIASGQIAYASWLLFLVLYVWQFPHFMAIAWLYRDDYEAADLKMITTGDPNGLRTGRHAVIFALILLPLIAWALWPTGLSGIVVLLIAELLGIWYLWSAVEFARLPNVPMAKKLFRVSLVFLPSYLTMLSIASLI